MKKALLKLLSFLDSRPQYISKEQKIGFSKKTKEEVRIIVKEKINNNYNSALHKTKKERTQRIELEYLIDLINKDPNYFTQSELNTLLEEYSN